MEEESVILPLVVLGLSLCCLMPEFGINREPSAPVLLDKGNRGSGNEIAQLSNSTGHLAQAHANLLQW